MARIVTVTMNPAVDKSTEVDHVVAERKLNCQRPEFFAGGGGINVARVIRRMGNSCTALYFFGGAAGAKLETLLREEGIDQEPIIIEGAVRENLIVYEQSSGQQYRFGMPGPEVHEREWRGMLDRLKTAAAEAAYLVASGSLPPGVPHDFYARAARAARETKTRFIVDTRGDALIEALEESVYLIKPNMRELGMIAGHEIEDEGDQEEVAQSLVGRGNCEVVVVSLGSAGALLVTAEMCQRIRAPSVPIRSKVGAGDSMVGGITWALSGGKSVHEAVQYGVAAGAAAVMTPGTELCRVADVERLYGLVRSG